ncbi:MAG TPA: PIN domain-containing protein [Ktedonobacteraceae bacterium]|jgi:predicted nucleic acid-binding protein|nr:PIN domain-containing protein [Ktedonobacteraceae bacterium]
MGWVDVLRGQVVSLDTAPLIYYIEKHPLYVKIVVSFFDAISRGEFTVVTSTITLLEILVKPLRIHDKQLAEKYRKVITQNVKVLPLSQEIAEKAASIRAVHSKVRTPDAVQLATAIYAEASFFVTNDVNLPVLPGLQMVVLNRVSL